MKKMMMLSLAVLSLSFAFSSEKKALYDTGLHFISKMILAGHPSMIKFVADADSGEGETNDNGAVDKTGGNGDTKDIAGFTVYTSFTFLTLISGIPLLAVGCYYSSNPSNETALPLIITGAVSLAVGVVMLALMICAVVIVMSMFKGFKSGSNKKPVIRITV
jgi:hypothetical protein